MFLANCARRKAVKMKLMLVAMSLLLLLLLLAAVIPAMTRLVSVSVTSYKAPRKTKNGPKLCALDLANETMSSSSEKQCSLSCTGDAICSCFNIKNLHIHIHEFTRDHNSTPVLALTSVA